MFFFIWNPFQSFGVFMKKPGKWVQRVHVYTEFTAWLYEFVMWQPFPFICSILVAIYQSNARESDTTEVLSNSMNLLFSDSMTSTLESQIQMSLFHLQNALNKVLKNIFKT